VPGAQATAAGADRADGMAWTAAPVPAAKTTAAATAPSTWDRRASDRIGLMFVAPSLGPCSWALAEYAARQPESAARAGVRPVCRGTPGVPWARRPAGGTPCSQGTSWVPSGACGGAELRSHQTSATVRCEIGRGSGPAALSIRNVCSGDLPGHSRCDAPAARREERSREGDERSLRHPLTGSSRVSDRGCLLVSGAVEDIASLAIRPTGGCPLVTRAVRT